VTRLWSRIAAISWTCLRVTYIAQLARAQLRAWFISSDAAFDLHWVDAGGKEIPLEVALKSAKAGGHKNKP
jgi:hypothetical protein